MSLELSQSHFNDAPNSSTDGASATTPMKRAHGRWKWWLLVALNIFFLLAGQAVATLLGRLYYDKGGSSIWMATLVQSGGFPVLLFIFPFFNLNQSPATVKPSKLVLGVVYTLLGLLLAGDNMMYSLGLLYLPVSTYSLICATQLAFNVVFSYFLNSQKITPYITNSVVLLTLSTALLACRSSSSRPEGVSTGKYVAGFLCTIAASAGYSLLLCLIQICFQKLLKKETFSVVLDVQVKVSVVATLVCVVGLFASGDWKDLEGEMDGFKMGRVAYVMILVWTAIAWQLASVGIVGLVFMVSSLFSNVIGTLGLPLVPVFAVIFFHEGMDGVKVVSMLMGIWGFVSFVYQNYLDESKIGKRSEREVGDLGDAAHV